MLSKPVDSHSLGKVFPGFGQISNGALMDDTRSRPVRKTIAVSFLESVVASAVRGARAAKQTVL
jgi:hypothetical protein